MRRAMDNEQGDNFIRTQQPVAEMGVVLGVRNDRFVVGKRHLARRRRLRPLRWERRHALCDQQ